MNYEDFPILSNADYELLKRELSFPKSDRIKSIEPITQALHTLSNCCSTTKKLNTKIINSINQAKKICSKQQNNFSSLFNIPTANNQIENLNLFTMIKKILFTSRDLAILAEDENKIYYKKLFLKSSQELIATAADILSTLQDSYIVTFNHM